MSKFDLKLTKKIEVLRGGKWLPTLFEHLVLGDVFRDADQPREVWTATTMPTELPEQPGNWGVQAVPLVTHHECHWPTCKVEVPPALWGCLGHWYRLPKPIRDKIKLTYRPGQEVTKNPSPAYVEAAREAQEWIQQNVHMETAELSNREHKALLEMARQKDMSPSAILRAGLRLYQMIEKLPRLKKAMDDQLHSELGPTLLKKD